MGRGEHMMGDISTYATDHLQNTAQHHSAKLKGIDEGIPTGQISPGIHKNSKCHLVHGRKTHKSEQKMGLQVRSFAAALLMLSECMCQSDHATWAACGGRSKMQRTQKQCSSQEGFPKSLPTFLHIKYGAQTYPTNVTDVSENYIKQQM